MKPLLGLILMKDIYYGSLRPTSCVSRRFRVFGKSGVTVVGNGRTFEWFDYGEAIPIQHLHRMTYRRQSLPVFRH